MGVRTTELLPRAVCRDDSLAAPCGCLIDVQSLFDAEVVSAAGTR